MPPSTTHQLFIPMERHHAPDQTSRTNPPPLVRPNKAQQPPKLNISYLLNDPTNEDKSDHFMRDAQSSRDLRMHRPKSVAGSSRRLHVSSAVRDRYLDRTDRAAATTTTTNQPPVHPGLLCPFCAEPFQHVSLLEEQYVKPPHQLTKQSLPFSVATFNLTLYRYHHLQFRFFINILFYLYVYTYTHILYIFTHLFHI